MQIFSWRLVALIPQQVAIINDRHSTYVARYVLPMQTHIWCRVISIPPTCMNCQRQTHYIFDTLRIEYTNTWLNHRFDFCDGYKLSTTDREFHFTLRIDNANMQLTHLVSISRAGTNRRQTDQVYFTSITE